MESRKVFFVAQMIIACGPDSWLQDYHMRILQILPDESRDLDDLLPLETIEPKKQTFSWVFPRDPTTSWEWFHGT